MASTHPIACNLLDLNRSQLEALVSGWGEKPYRARQLIRWMHRKGVADFLDMTDLAGAFRSRLIDLCHIRPPQVLRHTQASDATRKWIFELKGGDAVETVFIPEDNRGTLCISTQAGCAVNCRFCSTGHQGFSRNLELSEVIGQVWWARHVLERSDDARLGGAFAAEGRSITNVVFMGMGEPLLNYATTLSAVRWLIDEDAYGLSRRRVTVSTSGVVPMMDRLAADCPVALAVSLHAPNDTLRDMLVPLNKKYPLVELLAACERYLEAAPRDFITFEYVMLDGLNDQDHHARELIDRLDGLSCKLNLIPFNPFPASGLTCSPRERVQAFADILTNSGIVTTVRKTRGDDIDAACGQLVGEIQDRTHVLQRLDRRPFSAIGIKP